MIGVIERIKNNVLLKCSTLNENVISDTLNNIIDMSVYHFAEDVMGIIGDIKTGLKESELRNKTSEIIKVPIIKKVKRKLFIDSLALQITNDSFIEKYVKDEIDLDRLKKTYLKELTRNKNSNQLNMTEDLKLDEIMSKLDEYVNKAVIPLIRENTFLVSAVGSLIVKSKKELEKNLEDMIKNTDLNYLEILSYELKNEVKKEEQTEIEGEEDNMVNINEVIETDRAEELKAKFENFDDMTLFNKMILSLNTKEERLTRRENKIAAKQKELDERLSLTNKNIEANIEREDDLTNRKLKLNSREVELNSKLSEAEVIFLNMKPLIKGLSKIKSFDSNGGSRNE